MESTDTALKRMMPELVVSKRKLRHAEGISLVRASEKIEPNLTIKRTEWGSA